MRLLWTVVALGTAVAVSPVSAEPKTCMFVGGEGTLDRLPAWCQADDAVLPGPTHAAPAFPGAEGGGAASMGGRGGAVIEVTNLDDAGPGSLRACVEASGPRTCVFRVGGTIKLTSRGLWIDDPYLTVAGQTAPGGGIQIEAKATTQTAVMIAASDVIWRYTRIRHGYVSGGTDKASNVMIFNPAQRVIFDHNSTAWNQDEGIGVWSSAAPSVQDVTLSWNIVAEGLADHSTGWAFGGETKALSDGMTNVDMHHNLIMNNNHRNPLAKNKSGRIVSNLFYNWRFYAAQFGGGVQYDILDNNFKPGPMFNGVYPNTHELQLYPQGNCCSTPTGTPSFLLEGNTGINQPNPARDQTWLTALVPSENAEESGGWPSSYFRTTALPAQVFPITRHAVGALDAVVLPTVGASRRLACEGGWVSNRDSTDARLVSQYQNNTGITALPVTEADVGGYPMLAAGTPCTDADKDGMADTWEMSVGLCPCNAADRNGDLDGDGFTNLEEYLAGI